MINKLKYIFIFLVCFCNFSCINKSNDFDDLTGKIFYSNGKRFIALDLVSESRKEIINFNKMSVDYRYPMYFQKEKLFAFMKAGKQGGSILLFNNEGDLVKEESGYNGYYPSLSPAQSKIAYMKDSETLIVRFSKNKEKTFNEFYAFLKPLWLDDNRIIGSDRVYNIKTLNVLTGEVSPVGNFNLIPIACYSEKELICITPDNKRIYMLNLNSKSEKLIYKFKRSMCGYSMILSPGKNHFLVSELTPGILCYLSEKPQICIISMKKGDKKVIETGAFLDGGFWFGEKDRIY